MSAIRWEEPPARSHGRAYDWAAIGAALKAKPGQWALAVVCPNTATAGSTARYVRAGAYHALRELGRFEATARTVEGEARVYARYVGEGGAS